MTYRMYALWRLQILATFTIFAIVGVIMAAARVTSNAGPSIWFMAFWLLAVIWNGYWFLFRIAYQLDLSDSTLQWRTPLRRGSIALTDVLEMRPHRLGSSVEVIQCSDDSKVLVMVRKGFVDFAAEVQAVAPHVQIRVGTFAKLGNRLPGPRGFRRPH